RIYTTRQGHGSRDQSNFRARDVQPIIFKHGLIGHGCRDRSCAVKYKCGLRITDLKAAYRENAKEDP
uniref:40S ribosomal protein S29 n=1 Tax=Romanomermis culicivorax TaxID=13658 RepID=A0A915JBU4_ROMCU